MKLFAVVLLILALAPIAFADGSKPPKPPMVLKLNTLPTQISLVDAAKLDAALTHALLITMAAQEQLAPYNQEIDRICALYKIDRATLGTLKIDSKTGEITRPKSGESGVTPAAGAATAPK